VCPVRLRRHFDLPAGFEAVDVAVLEWIVAEGPGTPHFVLVTRRPLTLTLSFLPPRLAIKNAAVFGYLRFINSDRGRLAGRI
jgi:hypothetical protein